MRREYTMTTDQQGQKPALVRDTACLSDGGVSTPALWMSEALLFPLMTDRITKASLLIIHYLSGSSEIIHYLSDGSETGILPAAWNRTVGIGLLPCQKTTSLFILHCRRCLLDFQTGLT